MLKSERGPLSGSEKCNLSRMLSATLVTESARLGILSLIPLTKLLIKSLPHSVALLTTSVIFSLIPSQISFTVSRTGVSFSETDF